MPDDQAPHTKWPTARITHVGLNVVDIERTAAFYSRALGMRVMKRAEGRFATLSFGYQHHDIALIPVGSANERATIGLNHICFEMPNYRVWLGAYGRLIDDGVVVERLVDHRTGLGMYCRDPDGNSIELWCENFSSMSRAIEFGREMVEEFEENHIGYPLDPARLYQDYKRLGNNPPDTGDTIYEDCE